MKNDKKFKRFTHKNGVTEIHFRTKDGLEATLIIITFFMGLFAFFSLFGLMFLLSV
jgi:hypothetical protein